MYYKARDESVSYDLVTPIIIASMHQFYQSIQVCICMYEATDELV